MENFPHTVSSQASCITMGDLGVCVPQVPPHKIQNTALVENHVVCVSPYKMDPSYTTEPSPHMSQSSRQF